MKQKKPLNDSSSPSPSPARNVKVLRVGVLESERLIEERVFAPGETVTIGEGTRTTLQLPGSGFPGRFPLFLHRKGRCFLALDDRITGAIALEGSALTRLEQLRDRAEPGKDGTRLFPLEEQHRGKLVIGQSTLLFQFIPQPPRSQRGARTGRGWKRHLDATFWRILVLSAFVHVGVMTHALLQPPPPEPTIESMRDYFPRTSIIPLKQVPVEKTADKTADKPVKAAVPKVAMKTRPRPEKERPAVLPESPSKDPGGILVVLTSRFPGDSSAGKVLAGEGLPPDIRDMLDKKGAPGAVAMASGSTVGLKAGGGTGAIDVDVKGIHRDDRVIPVAQKKKIPPPVFERPQVDGDGRQETELGSRMRDYMPSITACYERALNQNPTLQGKFYLEFIIEKGGRVIQFELTSKFGAVDEVLAACLSQVTKRWRFDAAEADVEVSLPLVLTPQD